MGSESSDSIKTSLEKFLAMAGIDIEIDSPVPVPASLPPPSHPPPPPPPRVQQQWQQPSGFALYGQHAPHAVAVGGSSAMNRPYVEVPKPFMLPATGAATYAQVSVWKRGWNVHEDGSDSSAEKRKRRMIRNRESAARSRARKQVYNAMLEADVKSLRTESEMLKKSQAYNAKLEAEVKSLRAENGMLKKSQENLVRLSDAPPPPEPKRKLRRTTSAHF